MYKETFKCDSCGIIKKETNNWFMILDCTENTFPNYVTEPFNNLIALKNKENLNIKHACGIECAAKIEARLKANMQGVTKKSTPFTDLNCGDRNIKLSTQEVVSLLTKTD